MNFKIKRVFAVAMRHFLALINPFELTNQLYWVLLDVVTFGFLVQSMHKPNGGDLDIATICILTNLAAWYIVPRASIGMALTLLKDLTDSSFVGLMATPLTVWEWILAQISIAVFCSIINFAMGFVCIKLLFGFNVFSIGFVLVPAVISLFISSWILWLFLVSFLMFFGKRASISLYSIPWMLVTFCGVFYSVNILPKFCQSIAHCIPMFYIFDSLMGFIKSGACINSGIIKSMELNIFYFIVSITIFLLTFRSRKKSGFTRLELEG